MASGSGLATALAALKGHAVAVAVVGTLVVGGGATAAAVATGAVHVPGVTTQQSQNENGGNTARAAACAHNGDAQRLAGIFAPMFDGDTAKAQEQICTLFVGSDGHARGFGEVQQALEITAAIERKGDDACLTDAATHGTPTTKGKPPTAGTPAAGQQTFTAPSATKGDTMAIVAKVFAAVQSGTPLGKLAQQCDATHITGNPGGGQGQPEGTPEAKPTGTPGARPTGTPGAKPTGTPGAH